MSTVRRWYSSYPVLNYPSRRTNVTPNRRLCFQFIFDFYNAIFWDDECIGFKLIHRRGFCVPISDVKLSSTTSRRHIWTKVFAYHLSKMGYPEDDQPASIQNIYDLIDNVAHDPLVPIVVALCHNTSHYSVSESYQDIVDRITRESFETWNPKIIPATKSSIEGLEIVRLDSLEEAVIRQAPSCVICMESLEDININTAKDDQDQDHHHHEPMMITRLPCLHHFHGDCIVQWLEISHLCPVCRYSMPTMEVGEPSEPKRRRIAEVGEPSKLKRRRGLWYL